MKGPIYEPKGRAREYAPLALNLWATCSHGCKYCYCPGSLHVSSEDFHVEGPPRTGILKALREQLKADCDLPEPKLYSGDRHVLLSFIGDSYQGENNEITRKALEILGYYDVPFQVLTKAGMKAARDFDLYDNFEWSAEFHKERGSRFGTTLCFTDDNTRKEWEPNAASVYDREIAIAEAHAQGIYTWVSIEPVVMTRQALQVISWLSDKVDEFRVGKLNYHPHAKTIDWTAFALDALVALQESGCAWRIKDDLYKCLPPNSPQSSGGD